MDPKAHARRARPLSCNNPTSSPPSRRDLIARVNQAALSRCLAALVAGPRDAGGPLRTRSVRGASGAGSTVAAAARAARVLARPARANHSAEARRSGRATGPVEVAASHALSQVRVGDAYANETCSASVRRSAARLPVVAADYATPAIGGSVGAASPARAGDPPRRSAGRTLSSLGSKAGVAGVSRAGDLSRRAARLANLADQHGLPEADIVRTHRFVVRAASRALVNIGRSRRPPVAPAEGPRFTAPAVALVRDPRLRPRREVGNRIVRDAERSVPVRERHGNRAPALRAGERDIGLAVTVVVPGDDLVPLGRPFGELVERHVRHAERTVAVRERDREWSPMRTRASSPPTPPAICISSARSMVNNAAERVIRVRRVARSRAMRRYRRRLRRRTYNACSRTRA